MQKYSTFEHLAGRFNPDVQSRLLGNADVAYMSDTPTIGLLAEVYGWDNAVFWLKMQIASLDRYNGSTKECDLAVIGEVALLFARRYARVKLTEFMLFIARFKLGIYGKFYGVFDPISLGEAFKLFLRHREKEIAEIERTRNEPGSTWFIPPEGYTSLSWYQEVKRRAAKGDEEAMALLRPPGKRF